MKLTANQLRDGLKSRGLAVDGDKTALLDRYAAAVINFESRSSAGNSIAAEPIQYKVSVLSMTLERQFCIVSCKVITAWLFHTGNTCWFCLGDFPIMYSASCSFELG